MIAITGTPGTGKTSVLWYLSLFFKNVIDINRIALRHFVLEYDQERGSYVIDVDELSKYISDKLPKDSILVGHLSHLLGICEKVIVLRTHPTELKKRLKRKGWSKKKIHENLEAEAMAVITYEALEFTKDVFEIDTTGKHPRETFYEILKVLRESPEEYRAPKYDWSEAILEWY